jgi:uncharacterized repeat protein (TIGR01451 family)
MERSKKWIVYGLIIVALAGVALSGPAVWATPGQSPENQTVPKKTPEPPPRPDPTDSNPGEPPVPSPEPGVTVEPGLTVVPTATVAPVVPIAPAGAAQLMLQKRADREQIWPGATVSFTLTLSNPGTKSVQQISIEDTLPAGLEPGAVLEGRDAGWDGRTLRAQVAVLPPGGEYTIVFTTQAGAAPGPQPELTNVAQASVSGGDIAVAQSILIWPPLELPPVGGGWADLGRP